MKKTVITKYSITMTLGEMLEKLGIPKNQWVEISIEDLRIENETIPAGSLDTDVTIEWDDE